MSVLSAPRNTRSSPWCSVFDTVVFGAAVLGTLTFGVLAVYVLLTWVWP